MLCASRDFYEDISIDYLLSFDTNEKTEGLGTIEIDKENGVDQLDYIISRFNEIVVTIQYPAQNNWSFWPDKAILTAW